MRGVEAPFQLMVSAVALVMVLGLAYMILSHASQEDCNNKWEIELRDIATVLSTVIQGSAPTKMTVSFDFRCGRATGYNIQLIEEEDPQRCLKICGQVGGTNRCGVLRLRAVAPGKGGKEVVGNVVTCVHGMGGYINWGSGCDEGEDITDDLKKGYTLEPPFGTFLIKKLLGNGEPVTVCRVR